MNLESGKDHAQRATRQPLRTLKEMAQEFGVSPMTLSNLIHTRGGPKSRMQFNGRTHNNTWYEPRELRAWWVTFQK